MGLGWLWSRPTSSDSGELVDLETIDAWRRGLISAERGKEVMRQLANDPQLMRQLEELVAADELIRECDASGQEQGSKHNLLLTIRKWVAKKLASPGSGEPVDLNTIVVSSQLKCSRLFVTHEEILAKELIREFDASSQEHGNNLLLTIRKWVAETLASLKRPALAGGLAVSAVAAVLMVVVLPYQTSSNFSTQLDSYYASLDEPPKLLQVPWTPKISIRSGTDRTENAGETRLNELLGRAFQSGMAEGISRIESRFPDIQLNPGGYVSSDEPLCRPDIAQCERQVELAKMSGGWAVAVFLDCKNPFENKSLAPFSLLTSLQQAWRESNYENTLSKDIQKIPPDGALCQRVEELLVKWGRPNLSAGATP